ncbi:hypothetical protein Q3G72_032299 [Acer saccharum]|nr:hypothetical protein Q3G72_032299 [Acer saccharum]
MLLFSEKVRKLWNAWEVRGVILLSLLLQIVLVIFGAQRKYTRRFWVMFLVWSAYLTADWVATVALGNLANSQRNDSKDHSSKPDNLLQAFWTPILLVHLGGPDTITAYALEDNELWLRHFNGLVVQIGVAYYVFFLSWSNTALMFVAIPMFITGIIKYGEKTLVLRSSSNQHYKDSLFSTPDLCVEFINYIDNESIIPKDGIDPEDHYLVQAYFLFKKLEFLFAGRVLGNFERGNIYSVIEKKSAGDAFELVAVQFGFLYDMLYTKATIVYSRLGIFFRCMSLFSYVVALVIFSIIIDVHGFSHIDIFITYLLLAGAVVVEICAFIILFSSDWTKLWLIKLKTSQYNLISRTLINHLWKFVSCSHSLLTNHKRWSRSIGQYNMLSACIKDVQATGMGGVVQKIPFIGKLLEYRHLTWDNVNIDFQKTIFDYLKEKGNHLIKDENLLTDSFFKTRNEMLATRGTYALEKFFPSNNRLGWSITEVEYDHSLVIWHIATDLCYHGDLDDVQGDVNKLDPKCKISKCLSDYMLYLLVFCPSMLPKGNSEIRYVHTFDEAKRFFKPRFSKERGRIQASKGRHLLLEDARVNQPSLELVKDKLSVLQDGCKLAMELQNVELELQNVEVELELQSVELESQNVESSEHNYNKWEIISQVWMEMLSYAAQECEWREHGQQLRKGGELLTHVCLLMAHFGLSKQYVNLFLL